MYNSAETVSFFVILSMMHGVFCMVYAFQSIGNFLLLDLFIFSMNVIFVPFTEVDKS